MPTGSSGASDAELIQIPSGALFAVASTSAASARRLLFPDASLTVRRTSTPFTAQLVCTRIVDEGDASESDTDPADALDALAIDDDQRIFAVDESIAFRVLLTRPSEIVFVWRDPLATQASKAAVLEFVVSCEDTTLATVSAFEAVVYTCMFERREGKSHEDAEEAEVEAYIKFIKKKSQSAAVSAGVTDSVGAALPAKTSKEKSTKPEHRAVTATTAASSSSLQNPVKGKKGGMVGVEEKSSHKTPVKQTSKDSTSTSPTPMSMGTTPLAINNNVGDAVDKLVAPAGESIVKVKADLYLYDNRVSQVREFYYWYQKI
ncbi:hypothetical protein HDU83_007114 [Entophlyctis luteolus]|nr:hypothetical protein HDU83_007114 [Entophlyctis luteolus]